ncbi:MAG TPA: phosphoglycolate phosphatase [Burkholderiaceae bacterium]|nr:phosphoglycolate phosphatase [Burkholderiaceae bacterium]
MTGRRTAAAVLFDLDGTLIDSAPDLGAAADKMRTDRGLAPLGVEAYRPMAGAGARGMLGIAFGMDPAHAAYETHKDEFLRNYELGMTTHTQAFDGVAELVAALQARGLPWGIVTNKMERFTLPLVRWLPVLSGAQVVVGGDTTPHPKPHPAPLLEAARRLGVDPAHCVYVGDDERDIVAGRAAGMRTVAACYGYLGAQTDIQVWQANHVVKDPLGVLKCLELA